MRSDFKKYAHIDRTLTFDCNDRTSAPVLPQSQFYPRADPTHFGLTSTINIALYIENLADFIDC